MQKFFEYSDEVKQAITEYQPILALESTVITHGLPYPQNRDTALALEQIARDQGAVPATIAIMHGKIKIGLSADEVEHLARNQSVIKASVRDLSYAISQKLCAGTTVAATLFCAAKAGIKVFATGGIGGVHRGDAQDISADLIEIARTPIAVVCAGAKAILDLPRTLEFLETHSVPVIGYGTSTLPAFYTPSSPYELTTRVDDIITLAKILRTQAKLGIVSGTLIVNPIPAADAIPVEMIEPVIEQAIHKAEELQINGKAITPYLLSELALATQGKSMRSNIALIKNNVLIGAQLAHALHANEFAEQAAT